MDIFLYLFGLVIYTVWVVYICKKPKKPRKKATYISNADRINDMLVEIIRKELERRPGIAEEILNGRDAQLFFNVSNEGNLVAVNRKDETAE